MNMIQQALENAEVYQPEPPELEWQEPLELPDGLPPVEPFSLDLLPDALRPWIHDIAERIQCPIDFPAVGVMVTLASVIGRQVGVRPKEKDTGWLVIPNLWGAIIGRPGLMKSPALKEPMIPLLKMESRFSDAYKLELKDYEAANLVSQTNKKVMQEKLKTALKTGKQDAQALALAALEDDAQESPVLKRFLANDCTVEKLGEILSGNPNGILIYRDELPGFLRNLDKQGQESARAFYLEAWNGDGAFTFDRIGRGTVKIDAAAVSILGGIQPGPLQAYLQDSFRNGAGDDGLLQRFQLVVWPDHSKSWKNVDRQPDIQARETAYAIYERLANINPEQIGALRSSHDEIPYLYFDVDAQLVFNEWREDLEVRVRSGDEHPAIEAHLSKYRSLIPSLALILHLVDEGSGPITASAVAKACAWGEYLESHARRLYSSWLGADIVAAKTILKNIKDGKLAHPFTLRDVYRPGWSGLGEPEAAKKALDILADHNIVQVFQEKTGGRPKEEFFVNPKIWEADHGKVA